MGCPCTAEVATSDQPQPSSTEGHEQAQRRGKLWARATFEGASSAAAEGRLCTAVVACSATARSDMAPALA